MSQGTGVSIVTGSARHEILILSLFHRSFSDFSPSFFSDPGSRPSSPNAVENPLDAAVKARRKDQDGKETEGKFAKLELTFYRESLQCVTETVLRSRFRCCLLTYHACYLLIIHVFAVSQSLRYLYARFSVCEFIV